MFFLGEVVDSQEMRATNILNDFPAYTCEHADEIRQKFQVFSAPLQRQAKGIFDEIFDKWVERRKELEKHSLQWLDTLQNKQMFQAIGQIVAESLAADHVGDDKGKDKAS